MFWYKIDVKIKIFNKTHHTSLRCLIAYFWLANEEIKFIHKIYSISSYKKEEEEEDDDDDDDGTLCNLTRVSRVFDFFFVHLFVDGTC